MSISFQSMFSLAIEFSLVTSLASINARSTSAYNYKKIKCIIAINLSCYKNKFQNMYKVHSLTELVKYIPCYLFQMYIAWRTFAIIHIYIRIYHTTEFYYFGNFNANSCYANRLLLRLLFLHHPHLKNRNKTRLRPFKSMLSANSKQKYFLCENKYYLTKVCCSQ